MIIYKENNVTVFQSGMFQMNSAVVMTDDLVLVVDPGYLPREIEEIRQYVYRVKENRPIYLFFTHSDYDHIAGYGAFPEAKTIASKEFVESPLKEAQMKDLIKYDDDFYLTRPYKLTYPEIDLVIDSHGQKVTFGGTSLTFYHAFGHNNDGLVAVIEPLNIVIAGDYLSDIEFPFVYYRFDEYEKTLSTFQKLVHEKTNFILIPGHGSVADEQSEIQKRIDDSIEYLQLIKENTGMETFHEFVKEKDYHFLTNLHQRHLDNVKVWSKKSLD